MNKQIIVVGPFGVNCLILWKQGADKCWIIDPGADSSEIIAFCESKGLMPALIAFTHAHFDHISAVTGLLKKWPATPVHISEGDVQIAFSALNCWGSEYAPTKRPDSLVTDLTDGFVLDEAGIKAEILLTPGHTPAGVCYYFADEKLLLSGDTLFAGSCGRTDFPGGSSRQLSESLARLAKLPRDTVVVPGHGETTRIDIELKTNPFMRG